MRKNVDKAEADLAPSSVYACFDLQKVMNIPKNPVGRLYYLRKLNVYNLTFWSNSKKKEVKIGFVWQEGEANSGANEVASAVLYYMTNMEMEHDVSFCFGRTTVRAKTKVNFLLPCTMYTWVAAQLKVKIVHRYMERGHTQNEADNIHQVIEKASKPRDVNHPDQWYDIIQKAKVQREAYIVVKLMEHIHDFHELAEVHQRWTQPNV